MKTFNVMTQDEMENVNGGASLIGALLFLLKRKLDDFKRPKL